MPGIRSKPLKFFYLALYEPTKVNLYEYVMELVCLAIASANIPNANSLEVKIYINLQDAEFAIAFVGIEVDRPFMRALRVVEGKYANIRLLG